MFMGSLERSEAFNSAKTQGISNPLEKVAFRRGAGAGIKLGMHGYHPTQSHGHINAVRMARTVQNATHNQRFRLGVMEVSLRFAAL